MEDSSLSSLSDHSVDRSPEPPVKRCRVEAQSLNSAKNEDATDTSEDSGSDSGDENAWDEFAAAHAPDASPGNQAQLKPSGDMEITLDRAPQHSRASLTKSAGKKKGPSKIERLIRTSAHQVHVQCLLAHNLRRSGWASDKEVQKILVQGLSPGCKDEVERFKSACGDKLESNMRTNGISVNGETKNRGKTKGSRNSKTHKNQRDWGHKADHLEEGAPDLSHGDPTLRLLKHLCAFWRKKFDATAPGLRKQGWKDVERLEQETISYGADPYDSEQHGERIPSLRDFRELARKCQGSRDVGSQLFTALLRGLGIEARMVASLQPVGFGWTKAEDADPPRKKVNPEPNGHQPASLRDTVQKERLTASTPSKIRTTRRSKPRGDKEQPTDLSDDDSGLSDPPPSEGDDEDSVIDITPAKPINSQKRYDRDLAYPIYWTEVLSPTSNNWIPVDPIVLSLVSNNPYSHHVFEPRGSKADRAKQVHAYVVAYAADGTAKDVTVRYLKNHMWPGKTKGVRLPPEKVPVYNRASKIRRYEQYDWFKRVMSPYARDSRYSTTADDIEDARDLQAVHPQRSSNVTAGEETLQGYKNSADFVLERHLRREEAIRTGAEQVKTFTTGKGDKAKTEPVFRRADVAVCRTVESWHKEGRMVREGEQPLKHVPMRAVTLIRKREIEEAERESGEKAKQPLYAHDQTEWIIPPPIKDGVIPKNAFGNMDVYVPTMVPKGAVHIPLRGTPKICRKLGIDYAEACTGFEFGNKIAVPVLTGVVVSKENEDNVVDLWEEEEEKRVKKDAEKREKLALGMWKRLLTGLQVVERVRREYGDNAGVEFKIEKAVKAEKGKAERKERKKGSNKRQAGDAGDEEVAIDVDAEEAGSGGFLTNGEAIGHEYAEGAGGGGFFVPGEGDEPDLMNVDESAEGGFVLEDEDRVSKPNTAAGDSSRAPISLSSLHRKANGETNGVNDEDGASADEPDQSGEEEERPAPSQALPKRRGRPSKASARDDGSARQTAGRKGKGRQQIREEPKTISSTRARRSTANRKAVVDLSDEDEGEDE